MNKINPRKIYLTPEESAACWKFAKEAAPNMQPIEFAEKKTKARSLAEITHDNMIGKVAEVAAAKMLKENYGIDAKLDWGIYPRGVWDSADMEINGWRIDTKATVKGCWLLVEHNKLRNRKKEDKLSHIYILCKVGLEGADEEHGTWWASYKGFVTLARLKDGHKDTWTLPRGYMIPETQKDLQADNYGIHSDKLYDYPDDLADMLRNYAPSPKLTDNYAAPKAGEARFREG